MNKYLLLLVLVSFSYTLSEAQSLPRSIKVGSVNVKYDSYAKAIIEKEIQSLNNNRKYLDVLVDKMTLHFPVIERVLADAGVPDEMKYLCVQESVFDPDAISISGAVGYWQFKTETAKEIGLRVDGIVDERKHLAASTKAAAIYLNRSNQLFNNWMTTLLSYRIGQGAIKNHPATDWANKKEITVTNTTDWYLLRFLAHRFLLEIEYNKARNNPKGDFLYEYSNSKGKSITDIASELGVATAVVAVNNVWLKGSTVPKDKDYVVYIPMSSQKYKELSLNNANQKIEVSKNVNVKDLGFPVLVRLTQGNSKTEPIYFEINGKKGILAIDGDTPESIAHRADINVHRFLKYNDLDVDSRIIPNEVYYLKKKDRKAMVAYHTVEGSETLWSISQMYGIHLEDLMEKNRIAQIQRLQKGRLLWLIETRPDTPIQYVETPKVTTTVIVSNPPKEADTKPIVIIDKPKEEKPTEVIEKVTPQPVVSTSDKPKTVPVETVSQPKDIEEKVLTREMVNHTVKAKDTYFGIAQLYDMKVGELLSLNGIKLDEKLRLGQVIKVYKIQSSALAGALESEKKSEIKKKDEVNTKSKGSTAKADQNVKIIPEDKQNTQPSIATKEVKEISDKPSSNTNNTNKVQTKDENEIIKPDVSKIITREETDKTNTVVANGIHRVKAGETLFSIAKLHRITVAELKTLNKLNSNTVEIDQELVFSKSSIKLVEKVDTENVAPKPTKEIVKLNEGNIYHIMKVGETVFRVSKIYGVTVDQIVKWNNLKNFSVSVGQKLLIKK